MARRLGDFFQCLEISSLSTAKLAPLSELSNREREVLNLIAWGENNHQIAGRLHISPRTVGNHISNIFNKLQVTDRAQAIVKARSAGLGQ